MDAEAMNFQKQFDLLWCVESISHFERREEFFASAVKLLKPGGTLAIIDWFKKDNLTPSQIRKFIDPIEKGMLAKLQTMDDYESLLASNRLEIAHREVLNKNCAKTWDICIDILRDKEYGRSPSGTAPLLFRISGIPGHARRLRLRQFRLRLLRRIRVGRMADEHTEWRRGSYSEGEWFISCNRTTRLDMNFIYCCASGI